MSMIEVLRADIITRPHDDGGVSTIRVDESGADAKLKRLRITHVPADAYAVLLDGVNLTVGKKSIRVSQFSIHFDKAQDKINCICDAALVKPVPNGVSVSLIDMKSFSPNLARAKEQLDNSHLFIEYLCRVGAEFFGAERGLTVSKRVVKASLASAPVGQRRAPLVEQNGVKVVPVGLKGNEGVVPFDRFFD